MKNSITPVPVFPETATVLAVRDSWSSSLNGVPQFYYELQDANGNPLKNGNVAMTPEQWNNWPAGADDGKYILQCVAANLQLTLE